LIFFPFYEVDSVLNSSKIKGVSDIAQEQEWVKRASIDATDYELGPLSRQEKCCITVACGTKGLASVDATDHGTGPTFEAGEIVASQWPVERNI
jgi:hypothetical protein